MKTEVNPIFFLVAEDNLADRLLLQKAMEANGIENSLFVKDGQDLVDLLSGRLNPKPFDRSLPALILLDLNMPRLNGRETLKILKGDLQLKKIPIVVLTTSRNPEDVVTSYDGGASSFFTKPVDFQDLVEMVGLLKDYWMRTAELPGGLS